MFINRYVLQKANLKIFSKIAFAVSVLMVFVCSCSVKYSMSGASISPELNTYSVTNIQNQAPIIFPSLSIDITEALRDKCRNQTRLKLIPENGDAAFEGEIISYDTQPVGIQGNDVAAKTRLTISVRIRYTNNAEPKLSFDQAFTRFVDFDNNLSLSTVENDGKTIKELIELLNEDIFNKAFVNW